MLSELENYLQRIEDHHRQIIEMIDDMPREGLNFFPIVVPQMQVSNSIAILAMHVAGAEHHWIGEVVGGLPVTRDRDTEFTVRVRNSSPLIEILNNTLAETKSIFAKLTEADLSRIYEVDEKQVPGRWAILHVIDHTALHLGQMQITHQIWAKGDSRSSPMWFSRLPPK
ncbi:MAG TPA: DinB family protein [Longilinea sp.]|nr:DinB family protein [Longilinea sp.]